MEGSGIEAENDVEADFLDIRGRRGEGGFAPLFVAELSAGDNQSAFRLGGILENRRRVAQIVDLEFLFRGGGLLPGGLGGRGGGGAVVRVLLARCMSVLSGSCRYVAARGSSLHCRGRWPAAGSSAGPISAALR